MNSNSKLSQDANLLFFPRNASKRKRPKRSSEPFRVVGQAFRGARLLRKVEREAVDETPQQPGLVSLAALRINLEKLARGIAVPPESWERLANHILER